MADNNELPSIVTFSEPIADAKAPEPLPPGDYRATIRTAAVKLSQKGTKYGSIEFVISPDQFPADFDATGYPEGMKLIYNAVGLEDNAAARFRLKRFCEAIGAPAPAEIDVTSWIGLETTLNLTRGEWEGVPRNEVKAVKRS